MDKKCAVVVTKIMHKSGEWMEDSPLLVPVSMAVLDKVTKEKGLNAHCVASACTYGKRISLAATLGVAAEDDDDGNHVSVVSEKKDTISDTKKATENLKKKLGWTKEQREQAEDHGFLPPDNSHWAEGVRRGAVNKETAIRAMRDEASAKNSNTQPSTEELNRLFGGK